MRRNGGKPWKIWIQNSRQFSSNILWSLNLEVSHCYITYPHIPPPTYMAKEEEDIWVWWFRMDGSSRLHGDGLDYLSIDIIIYVPVQQGGSGTGNLCVGDTHSYNIIRSLITYHRIFWLYILWFPVNIPASYHPPLLFVYHSNCWIESSLYYVVSYIIIYLYTTMRIYDERFRLLEFNFLPALLRDAGILIQLPLGGFLAGRHI
jgi:hypothetical protein